MAKRKSIEERLWAKVNFLGPTPSHIPEIGNCWEWVGHRNNYEYGQIRINRRDMRTHRLSREIANGPIPEGLFVLHKCDNPPCVRPDHLRIGTNADNVRDMMAKGRYVAPHRGYGGNAKLSVDQVCEARLRYAQGESIVGIGGLLGVHSTTISLIVHRKTWKHVE